MHAYTCIYIYTERNIASSEALRRSSRLRAQVLNLVLFIIIIIIIIISSSRSSCSSRKLVEVC